MAAAICSFLLASLRHPRERAADQKPGRGQSAISFDALEAEQRCAIEPADSLSPDRLFDRNGRTSSSHAPKPASPPDKKPPPKPRYSRPCAPCSPAPAIPPRYTALGEQLGMS